MSTIHHRSTAGPQFWWFGAAVVVGILLTLVVATAQPGTSVRDATNANMITTTYSGTSLTPADNLCSVLRQDALSVELAHSRCSASHGSGIGTTAEKLCSVLRQDALSVELAHSRCSARRS